MTRTNLSTGEKDSTMDAKDISQDQFKEDVNEGHATVTIGGLHRRLGIRHIQLVAIGGSIGTGLFIAIGTGLHKGGPASLLLAFIIECLMVSMLNNCLAEMSTYMAVPGGFIGLAGKWCDDALGFMAGWNFFIYMALTVPFEISAVSVLLEYWRDDIPHIAVILICMGLYA